MGLLVNGEWFNSGFEPIEHDGKFIRAASQYRNWITPDGGRGPSGTRGFKAESGRYHLYVSQACPWAHRTIIFRALKGLEKHITVSVVHPLMLDKGWSFAIDQYAKGDSVNGCDYLYQVYLKSDKKASTRVTVPVLWDKKTTQIVSNESSEIIRMMNSAFDHITKNENDFFPKNLRENIENLNKDIYRDINNGVYKAGLRQLRRPIIRLSKAFFNVLNRLSHACKSIGSFRWHTYRGRLATVYDLSQV